jgi:hypothetical protein
LSRIASRRQLTAFGQRPEATGDQDARHIRKKGPRK